MWRAAHHSLPCQPTSQHKTEPPPYTSMQYVGIYVYTAHDMYNTLVRCVEEQMVQCIRPSISTTVRQLAYLHYHWPLQTFFPHMQLGSCISSHCDSWLVGVLLWQQSEAYVHTTLHGTGPWPSPALRLVSGSRKGMNALGIALEMSREECPALWSSTHM